MAASAEVRLLALSDFSADSHADALTWLNAEERARLAAISATRRRLQFIAGHHLARCMAAAWAGGTPDEWQLQAQPGGAPMLVAPSGHAAAPSVSLSHSGDWVGCAVADVAIGLDLESHTSARDLGALAHHVLSATELAHWRTLPTAEQPAAFYALWTLKEAQGKHAGTGLRLHQARQQSFVAGTGADAPGSTWQAPGLSVGVFGEPGLRVRMGAPLQQVQPCYWRLLRTEDIGAN
jgi:phosphopantetheinyl transferase